MTKLMIIIFAIAISSFNIFSQPLMQIVGGDTVNWGKVKIEQSPLTHSLKITNIGNDRLHIASVKPSCGCTTAPIDKKDLEKGDTATIQITLNIPASPGNTIKAINISTNDPRENTKIVYLVADVIFPLKFFPTKVLGAPNLIIGREDIAKVVITNTTDEDIMIKEVEIDVVNTEVNLKDNDILKAHGEIIVEVKFNPKTLGVINGELKFKTTHPDIPRVSIPVRGVVIGELPKEEFQDSQKK
jgi:hypothetical protein